MQPILSNDRLDGPQLMAAASADRESVDSKEIEEVPQSETCGYKIIFSCHIGSVLCESSRLFACVTFTANVMDSLFYLGSESAQLSDFFESSVNIFDLPYVAKLSNFFESSVSIPKLRFEFDVLGAP